MLTHGKHQWFVHEQPSAPRLTGSPYGFSPSSHVRQHLRECVRHHPEVVFRYGQVSPPDATGERIHPLPPDPKPAEAAAGGILPARLDVHQRHRHEHGTNGSVCLFIGLKMEL